MSGRLGPTGVEWGRPPVALGLAIFFVQIGTGITLFAIFQQYLPEQLHLGDSWGGYLLSAYGGARFVSEGPTGALNDRIERKLAFLLGLLVILPAIAALGLADASPLFLCAAALFGAGSAFIWPAAYAIVADLYPAERRGSMIGLLNLSQLLGFGLGALVGALLVEDHATLLFIVAMVAVAVASIPVAFGVRSHRSGRLLGRRAEDAARPGLRSVWDVRLAALLGLVLISGAGVAMVVPAIRPYGSEQLQISFSKLTIGLIPAVVIGGLLYLPAGRAADRFGRVRPFIFGQILLVIGALTVSESASLPVGAIGAILIFAGNVFSVPAFNAAVLDLAPESHRGTLIGLTVAVSGLGLALGPAAGGFLSGAFGPPWAFRASALVAAFTVMGILAYARVFPAPRPTT